MTESGEFDAVSDEIRKWSSLSETNARFVSAKDGVLNEFEMMAAISLAFCCFTCMVSIMVNKLAYKPSVKDIMDKY